LRLLEQQRSWFAELKQLQDQQAAASEQLHSAHQQWTQLQGDRQHLSRLEQLAPQRHQFARQRELASQRSPLAASIQQQRQQQAALQQRLQQLEQAQQAAGEHLATALA
ncbi:hypothetical protein, partial [Pseudomonas sp. PS01300]|uniref:hypothetical protein n=1 Tax=Pseudomonas sp. PS01300 TaxID=2991436 RepID=UPI00249B1653